MLLRRISLFSGSGTVLTVPWHQEVLEALGCVGCCCTISSLSLAIAGRLKGSMSLGLGRQQGHQEECCRNVPGNICVVHAS